MGKIPKVQNPGLQRYIRSRDLVVYTYDPAARTPYLVVSKSTIRYENTEASKPKYLLAARIL